MNRDVRDLIEKLYQEVVKEEGCVMGASAGEVAMKQSIVIEDENGKETWSAFARDESGNTFFLLDEEYSFTIDRFGNNNNYKESDLRKKAVVCDPILRAQKVFGEDAFVPVRIDLKSLDGFDTYGICEGDLSGVMDFYIYNRNRRNIKVSSMHLSTPYSTNECYDSESVLCVCVDGSVDCYDCGCRDGVRPFFILKSTIPVVCEESEDL